MKKIIYGVMMVVAVLLATACSSVDEPAEELVTINFSAAMEGGNVSRATDCNAADVLYYHVYKAKSVNGTDEYTYEPTRVGGTTEGCVGNEFQFSLSLVKNQIYCVIFWAQKKCEEGQSPYTLKFDENPKVVVNYDEVLTDAFYGKTAAFKVEGNSNIEIGLKRPFAQLNVFTNDYAKANELGFTIKNAEVTLRDCSNVFNMFTGKGESVPNVQPVTMSVSWEDGLAVSEGEDNTKVLSGLFLPIGDGSTADVTVKVKDSDWEGAISLSVPNCPLTPNFKTNILGSWLTTSVNANVTISDWERTETKVITTEE